MAVSWIVCAILAGLTVADVGTGQQVTKFSDFLPPPPPPPPLQEMSNTEATYPPYMGENMPPFPVTTPNSWEQRPTGQYTPVPLGSRTMNRRPPDTDAITPLPTSYPPINVNETDDQNGLNNYHENSVVNKQGRPQSTAKTCGEGMCKPVTRIQQRINSKKELFTAVKQLDQEIKSGRRLPLISIDLIQLDSGFPNLDDQESPDLSTETPSSCSRTKRDVTASTGEDLPYLLQGCYNLEIAKQDVDSVGCSQHCQQKSLNFYGLSQATLGDQTWSCYCITDVMLSDMGDGTTDITVYSTSDNTVYSSSKFTPIVQKVYETNSVDSCVDACQNEGATYVALKGTACVCMPENSLHQMSKVADSDCTVACPGASDKTCGGATSYTVYKSDDSLCYKVEDSGRTYRGNISVTVDFETCVEWYKATKCDHNPFSPNDLFDGLESNYCRNPGDEDRPWCYINVETCTRKICDVCQKGTCNDVDSTCADDMNADSNFCQSKNSHRFCRKSCSHCSSTPVVQESVTEVSCQQPDDLPDCTCIDYETTNKTVYKVAEAVDFECGSDNETEIEAQCLTDGSWSSGRYACGGCPTDWTNFKGNCYKFFDVKLNYPDAVDFCLNEGGVVSSAKDETEEALITFLRKKSRNLWLGATDTENEGNWMWTDGEAVTYSNWASGQPDNLANYEHCAILTKAAYGSKWNDVYCDFYNSHAVVCKRAIKGMRELCDDQITTCDSLINSVPDACKTYYAFAQQTCPKSCGVCEMGTPCNITVPENAALVGNQTTLLPGESVEFECMSGYVLESGALKRACLYSGQLGGVTPVCAASNQATSGNSDLEIVSRAYPSWQWWVLLGDNDNMRIERAGRIVAWHFYTGDAGKISLQIVRPSSPAADKSQTVEMIHGKSFNVKNDREYYEELSANEQTDVEEGDLIALDFDSVGGVLKYDNCDVTIYPEAKDWKYGWFWDPETVGQTWNFKLFSSCRIYSVRAIIGPVSEEFKR